MTNPQLILASQSPRRKELMDGMGLAGMYEVQPSEYEELLDSARSPAEVAQELGYGKALWVAERNPGAWAIGSDTIVTVRGVQLGKADDITHAREMLKSIAGSVVLITTSVALVRVHKDTPNDARVIDHYIGFEEAKVHVKPYDKSLVEAYLAQGQWQDKAAAFGIQAGADTLTDGFEGNYDTVLGLPTHTLATFLQKIGVHSQPVELQAPVPKL